MYLSSLTISDIDTDTPTNGSGSSPGDTGETSQKSGLGVGQIVGIAIGSVSLLAALVKLAFWLRKHRRLPPKEEAPATTRNDNNNNNAYVNHNQYSQPPPRY